MQTAIWLELPYTSKYSLSHTNIWIIPSGPPAKSPSPAAPTCSICLSSSWFVVTKWKVLTVELRFPTRTRALRTSPYFCVVFLLLFLDYLFFCTCILNVPPISWVTTCYYLLPSEKKSLPFARSLKPRPKSEDFTDCNDRNWPRTRDTETWQSGSKWFLQGARIEGIACTLSANVCVSPWPQTFAQWLVRGNRDLLYLVLFTTLARNNGRWPRSILRISNCDIAGHASVFRSPSGAYWILPDVTRSLCAHFLRWS